MKVSRTIAKRNINVQPGEVIMGEVALSTRYAFSTKLETMFASGLVGSLIRREFADKDLFVPSFNKHQTISIEAARDMQSAVEQRRAGFSVLSAMDGVDPFLTDEQSTNLWNTIDWATSHSQKKSVLHAHDEFPSVAAGALVLRESILEIEHPAYLAGIDLLEANKARGKRPLRSTQPPEIAARFAPDVEGGTQVIVVLANELAAR